LTGYSPEECKAPALRWGMVQPEDREWLQAEDERNPILTRVHARNSGRVHELPHTLQDGEVTGAIVTFKDMPICLDHPGMSPAPRLVASTLA
jgi:hypothetical protein